MNAEKKNFYGWILLVAIGIMFLCSSGFILVGASVVNPLMMADSSMNMNATLMGLGFTLFVLCQGIPAPLIGQFITKYGQKKTFIVGGLLLIIGGLLMAFVVKTTIGYLIAFGVILSIGSQMAGQVTMQTSVSAWFVQKRALAMSIATVIGAIGSFISPRILNSIVASTGRWQNAWLLVAGLGVVVIIIAVALVVDKPSDKGQYPDGIEPGSAVAAAQKFSKVYKTSEAYDHKAVLKTATSGSLLLRLPAHFACTASTLRQPLSTSRPRALKARLSLLRFPTWALQTWSASFPSALSATRSSLPE